MSRPSVIAIDGPAGAGKSTLARLLANKLGYRYLDTGAMYRALTWLALESGIDIDNSKKLIKLAREAHIKFTSGDNKIHINGKDVTSLIRNKKIDESVSDVAQIKEVRQVMLKMQRDMAREGMIVVDGRDIGSRVLPDADLKVFLTASLEERAKRRYEEIKDREPALQLNDVKKDIKQRDYIDQHREESPLVRADDAVLLNTTGLNIEESVNYVIKLIEKDV